MKVLNRPHIKRSIFIGVDKWATNDHNVALLELQEKRKNKALNSKSVQEKDDLLLQKETANSLKEDCEWSEHLFKILMSEHIWEEEKDVVVKYVLSSIKVIFALRDSEKAVIVND